MARKSERNDSADLEVHKAHVNGRMISSIVVGIAKWGSLLILGIIYAPVVQAVVEALAGQETNARFSVEWLVGGHYIPLAAVLFGIVCLVYARREAKLRKDTVERLHWYQERFETFLDPKRSSSRLTKRGETRKEDQ